MPDYDGGSDRERQHRREGERVIGRDGGRKREGGWEEERGRES